MRASLAWLSELVDIDVSVDKLVELLVHSDDLAVSIGVPSPEFDEAPADLVVSVLARFARRRHGTAPVLRALARQERAYGSIAAF